MVQRPGRATQSSAIGQRILEALRYDRVDTDQWRVRKAMSFQRDRAADEGFVAEPGADDAVASAAGDRGVVGKIRQDRDRGRTAFATGEFGSRRQAGHGSLPTAGQSIKCD